MNAIVTRFALSLPLCILAACGGGGGGGGSDAQPQGGPGIPDCNPGQYLPIAPAGLGVAGLMDGIWEVVNQEIVADARTRDPDLSQARYDIGSRIEFRSGIVYEGSEPATGTEPSPSNLPQIDVVAEFLCNDLDGALSRYGFGFRFSGAGIPPSAVRQVALFGTTGPVTAKAIVIEEQIFPFLQPGVDRFMVYQVELTRVGTAPSILSASSEDPDAK